MAEIQNGKKPMLYKNYLWLVGVLIIVAIALTFFSPFDFAVKNASTFVNGVTTSIGIISAFGASVNTLMFHQVTKNNPQFKSRYFEVIGLYFIPLLEAGLSYIFLATASDSSSSFLIPLAIRTSIAGFFTAILVGVAFYLIIASQLRMQENQTDDEKKDDKKREWQLTVKNGDKQLEVFGMDAEIVNKILESWKKNINPNNPDPKEEHLDK